MVERERAVNWSAADCLSLLHRGKKTAAKETTDYRALLTALCLDTALSVIVSLLLSSSL